MFSKTRSPHKTNEKKKKMVKLLQKYLKLYVYVYDWSDILSNCWKIFH